MRQDMGQYVSGPYGFKARVEFRTLPYIALVRTSDSLMIRSKGGELIDQGSQSYIMLQNARLPSFVQRIKEFLDTKGRPFEPEISYRGPVDIELNTDISDMAALNKELSGYVLRLVTKVRKMDVLIITNARN